MKKCVLICLFIFCVTFGASAQFFSWVKAVVKKDINTNTNMASGKNLIATTSLGTAAATQPTPFYLMVHDTSSALQWSKKITSSAFDFQPFTNTPGIAIDKVQHVILAGSFRGSLSIDSTVFTAPSVRGSSMYVVKYNASGKRIWSRSSTFVTTNFINCVNTGTDQAGNIYVTGSFQDTLTIGSRQVISSGQRDAFVAKYDTYGNLLWLKKLVP
jgi:hypothetical protein